MKLTIVPATGSVGKDNVFYNDLDLSSCNISADIHALQWQDSAGWIEYNSPLVANQPITELPAWAMCCVTKWSEADAPKPPPTPTAEQNKRTAANKLSETDWTTIPDVADPSRSNPYLSNVQDFVNYRNAIRQYAVYPVSGNIDWPAIPQEVWTKV